MNFTLPLWRNTVKQPSSMLNAIRRSHRSLSLQWKKQSRGSLKPRSVGE